MSAFSHVLVIGAGAFGASAALELAQLGHKVTVVDRSAEGYATQSAASHDLNKIDDHYRDLGKKCIELWRTHPLYAPFYHEVGILFRSDTSSQARKEWVQSAVRYANQPVQNAYPGAAPKVPLTRELTSNADVRASFPASLRPHLGDVWTKFDSHEQLGYLNPQAGWTEARAATFAVLDEARRLGAEVVSNVRITQLLSTDGQRRVRGAVASDGRVFEADSVIVAAGCWTASLLETLGAPLPRPVLAPSAHCVVTFELTPDVARLFRGMPVLFNMSSGLYAFEPNQDRILKCALHRVRCILTQTGATTPNPRDFQGEEFPIGDGHPHVEELTKEVLAMFPVLKLEGPSPTARRRPTRMCWYSDTLDENFLIDFHPDFDNVLGLTQFLPMLGRLIASRLLRINSDAAIVPDFGLSEHQRRVFSYTHHAQLHEQGAPTKTADSIRVGPSEPHAAQQAPSAKL